MMAVMTEVTRDDLSRLCKERRGELRLSMDGVAASSGDPTMASSWVARLETGKLRDVPRRERLAALARGLQLSYQTVARAAAAQFLDIKDDAVWSEDGDIRVVADHMGEMDERGRQEMLQIAEILIRRPNSNT
jgi:hypothetical protein